MGTQNSTPLRLNTACDLKKYPASFPGTSTARSNAGTTVPALPLGTLPHAGENPIRAQAIPQALYGAGQSALLAQPAHHRGAATLAVNDYFVYIHGGVSTIEVHPKLSEAPHLRSSIPRPKIDFSKNKNTSRRIIPWPKSTKRFFSKSRLG